MLIAEYDYDVDIAVQREEEREIALQEGIAQGKQEGEAKGFSIGVAQGKQQGISEGSYQKALETAKNLLALNLSIENIARATGLTEAEVKKL